MGEIFRHVLTVLPAFLLACLAVAALPGPSTALFLHRTVRDGRAAGLAAVAGNEIGVFCWALAAGAGLTGLLRANRWLYLGLHVVGAVVLVYLGVSAWRSARRQDGDAEFGAAFARRLPSGRTPAAAFRASLVTIAAIRRRPSSRSRSSRSSCPGTARSSAPHWRWPPSNSSSTPPTAWASCCSRPGPGAGCPAPRYAVGWNASWARRWSRSASTWPPRPAEPAGAGSAGRDRSSPATPRPIADHERGRCAPLAASPRLGVTRARKPTKHISTAWPVS